MYFAALPDANDSASGESTDPRDLITALNPPGPDLSLWELVPQGSYILGSEPTPSIVSGGVELDTLHLVALFCKESEVSVQNVMFL